MSKNNFWHTLKMVVPFINEIIYGQNYKLKTRVPSVTSASSLHRPRRCRATPAGLSELHCHFSWSPIILTLPRNKQHLSGSSILPSSSLTARSHQPCILRFNRTLEHLTSGCGWFGSVWTWSRPQYGVNSGEVWCEPHRRKQTTCFAADICRHMIFLYHCWTVLTLAPCEPWTAGSEKSPSWITLVLICPRNPIFRYKSGLKHFLLVAALKKNKNGLLAGVNLEATASRAAAEETRTGQHFLIKREQQRTRGSAGFSLLLAASLGHTSASKIWDRNPFFNREKAITNNNIDLNIK